MSSTPAQPGIVRPPVVVIMGHIDHGKSTLLDYIRKSNVVAGEAGGITQHISAYEVQHPTPSGVRRITFLDTPGHEAFSCIRTRGASVADVAVLVVSAEDGVMPQTIEAYKSIMTCKIPYVVALNKIDSPKANIDRAKQTLAEHDIMIEEWGGSIPCVPISAKTGDGIPDLLDLVLLVAEIEEMTGDPSLPAEGVLIEAHRDGTRGISATLIIKNGTLRQGDHAAAAGAFTPVRIMESFTGAKISEATFSSPVAVVGWSAIPEVGSVFKAFKSKKEAQEYSEEEATRINNIADLPVAGADQVVIPIIVKTEVSGTIEAIAHEVAKLKTDRASFAIVFSGPGRISEVDMKRAMSKPGTVVIGFGTDFDPLAAAIRDRQGVLAKTFNVIYDLSDWLKEIRDQRTPRLMVDEVVGAIKILKVFNWNKNLQVLGGRVTEGSVKIGAKLRVKRRDEALGWANLKELQKNKSKADVVLEGDEFGMALDSKVELAGGDVLEAIESIEK